MKSWKECCEEVGYDPTKYNPPSLKFTYFAYKNGACFEVNTLEEAKGISKFTEKVELNREEVDAYFKNQGELEVKAVNLWYKELMQEYNYLPKPILEKCYNLAYDFGHSAGYDEVASYMYDFVNFAEYAYNFKKDS